MPQSPGYVELHAYSNFSFLEGASHPETLATRAVALGLPALALTDRDGLYGSVRFGKTAKALGLPAIVGCEMTLDDGNPKSTRDERPRLVLLVENAEGYKHLTQAIARAQFRSRKNDARLQLEDLQGATQGLIALSAGPHGVIDRAIIAGNLERATQDAAILRDLFPNAFYCELQHHLHQDDARRIRDLIEIAKTLALPLVATNGVHYAEQTDARLADILACIRHGVSLADAGTRLRPNGEYYLKNAQRMTRIFSAYPQALSNTLHIAERCSFRLERLAGQFPDFIPPAQYTTTTAYLRHLVAEGARKRYGDPPQTAVVKQLEHELALIEKQELCGYFLIVHDIMRAASDLGVLAQGRGSAANSAVCYALGITAVDPVGMKLLFERFMSADRSEIPDIDIDFAHDKREHVIQYIYTKYGREHAAMAAEVITYRTRSSLRDVAKTFGLSTAQIGTLTDEYDASESLASAVGGVEPALSELILFFCRRIDGFPRHMGIHSGGMVITRDPLIHVAGVERATMPGRTVLQWDKDDLQDLGLIKIDLLGLGMLSLLQNAFDLYKECNPQRPALDLASIPQEDPATYDMLQRADSIGVFQVESRAQQSMLPRLAPKTFYDLVMQVAIIRPGPIQGEMIHPFLRRRAGKEAVTYHDPRLRPILERTLGVPLFQEQGMRMAMECAGFTAGEADTLRRAMGHKRSRERMAQIYPKLVHGMVKNGIERKAADALFHMLEGFADYGFPESHAASFALLAYASAYLKCHEHAIFTAAILNVQPMGFYSTEVLVQDAKRHAVVVKPVTVNASRLWTHVDRTGAVQLGYHVLRNLGSAGHQQLEAALADAKPFADLRDFMLRSQLPMEALESLANAGGFSPWFAERRAALWALRDIAERKARGPLAAEMETYEASVQFRALRPVETTRLDLWSTGIAQTQQPIAHLRPQLTACGVLAAAQLHTIADRQNCRIGGLVITRQRPGTAKGYVFLTIEDETGLVNVIVRPAVYEEFRRVIRRSAGLIIDGRLQRAYGSVDILACGFEPLNLNNLTESLRSRNFH